MSADHDLAADVPLLEFHPAAPRPDLLWRVQLPSTWILLDTHPATWRSQAERIAEDYLPGHRLRAAEKRLIREQLTHTVTAAQDAGVLLTLVLPGLLDDGTVSAATLLLRWEDSAPRRASLAPAQHAFAHLDPQIKRTPEGNSWLSVHQEALSGPLTNRRPVYTRQGYLPLPDSTWTLIISGSAPTVELAEIVGEVVARLVNSVRVVPGGQGERIGAKAPEGAEGREVAVNSAGLVSVR
ncbi:MAG: hypothetical protein Q4G50_07380 [Corynebacterium sp.]|uniref:hypothetical protein n=1 Tax=Corynebacterium sp. TaxID=1720 RepID=UPI0026DFCDDB|nr:hypothetical protein [Corynebacterium sp.]MDO5669809.1 hypothetical protein [Corynebacterium sp.]